MLELDDFGRLLDIDEEKEEKISAEEIERIYQQKILETESFYKSELKRVEKEAFLKGFKDGEQKKEIEKNKEIEILKKRIEDKKKDEIEFILNSIKKIEIEAEKKNNLYFKRISEIISECIGEILEFLYINTNGAEIVLEKIEEILDEFKNTKPLGIIFSPKLYDFFKERFEKIKITKDDKLKGGDFIIEFANFNIENRIAEKIEVIKDEIKREIKNIA